VPKVCGHYRWRSPEAVIAELRHAVDRLGIAAFEIVDDAFNVRLDRSKEFCRQLIQAQLRLPWTCPNGIRADRVDDELARLMADSGCISAQVGVESGDPDVFGRIGKGCSLEAIEQGIHRLQAAGINVGGFFIIGLPGDSLEGVRKSVRFARRNRISAHFNLLVPYPGTEIWSWVHSDQVRLLQEPEQGLHFSDQIGRLVPVFETADFPAAARIHAYEMAHTLLERFDLLIPALSGRLAFNARALRLLARHCPQRLPSYVVRRVAAYCRRRCASRRAPANAEGPRPQAKHDA